MSTRVATILAVAAVISSLCLYGSFGQVPERAREATEGAIVVEHAHAPGERPGRYQLSAVASASGTVEAVVIDTHTGQCWVRRERSNGWNDWGSPVKQK